MTPFTLDQWIIVLLVFLLGLILGMYLLAGRRWKRRYHDEVRRREAVERDWREQDAIRDAALRHPVDRDRGPL